MRLSVVSARRFAARTVVGLLQDRRERARPATTRLRLVATLFGRASNVLMVAVAAAVCGGAAFWRGSGWLPGAVAAGEIGLLLARCAVILAFNARERAGHGIDPAPWLARFGLLAISSSLCWGALCLVALAAAHDPVLYVLPILATVGTAGAVAARNSGVPRLARLQLAASLAPILAGCVLADDHGFRLLLILVPALWIGLLILIAERNQQLVALIEAQDELGRLSHTDALTQLPNRRALDAALGQCAATGQAYAVLMVDVDHFKAFNDRHGHLAGDAMLCRLAATLREALRGGDDVVGRYGGEEFAVLLQNADAVDAGAIAERLRARVEAVCSNPFDGSATTISIGVSTTSARHDPTGALREADAALYRAKRGGRNRVETTPGPSYDGRVAA